ncbi:MAG: CRISPR-associated endonuclease Cas2 [Campylobacterota bacterium]|nr:CRISPR-associated endonuclease Cas2 [Campylobacterota bacterium]
MKKFNFLICYDISDVKRLSKVAKSLEKEAIRIQKSIFYYMDASKEDIEKIVKILESIISTDEDDIRIYKIDIYGSLNINSAINLKKPNIIGAVK